MYVFARGKKPTLYHRDDGMFVCTGQGVEAAGASENGAYTRWKHTLAYNQLPVDKRPKIAAPKIARIGL